MSGKVASFPLRARFQAPDVLRGVVLVVGEADDIDSLHLGAGRTFASAEINEVGAELLETLQPDVVLSPLMGRNFDCVDLAQILTAVGYRGAYRVVTAPLPAPEMVRRELRKLCPGIEIELVMLPPPRRVMS